jgi:hypothetical protein
MHESLPYSIIKFKGRKFGFKNKLVRYKVLSNEELLQIGINFRAGMYPKKTWDSMNVEYGYPFKNGEAWRNFVRRTLKKQNKTIDKIEQPKVENVSGEEEFKRVEINDCGDFYRISSNKRSIEITKEKVKMIKLYYCDDDPLTINELCRRVDIPRRDFMLIKSAFNITHDDVPYLDEELDNDSNIDSLVDETLERKKEKYFLKLQQREIQFMKEELNKYRKNDYVYEKLVKAMSEININFTNYSNRQYKPSNRQALLDLADIHMGLKATNYWNKYSIDEANKRFEKLTKDVINIGLENNISELHVSFLGDGIAGIIHDSIRLESEVDVTEQVKLVATAIAKMLLEFSTVFKKVIYSDLEGNHGRVIPAKEASLDRENFEKFIGWGIRLIVNGRPDINNIEFEENYYDDGIIAKNIGGVLIFETHGHEDQFNKVASDLTMMIEKPSEVHMAHVHHNKSDEFHGVEVLVCRSFCGTDTYSKGKRLTSKAGQRMYIYENGNRKYIADIIF